MNKLIKTSLLLCLPIFLQAQVRLINEGVILNVSNGVDLRVEDGSINNKNTGQINNDGNIYLDWGFDQTTGATYTGGTNSWLWFEGAANQNATGDAPLNIAKLRVDNGNRLVLGNSVNVSDRVDLTNNGNIELGNFNLVVASGGVVTGYDAANYIITNNTGFLQQEVAAVDVVFPVGNSAYNPVTVNNIGTIDNFTARVEDVVYDNGTTGTPETSGVVNTTWHIEEVVAGGSMADITVQWLTGQELGSFDRNNCAVSHWDGIAWDHSMAYTPATNVGVNTWTQIRSGQTTFSPFAVEDLVQILPVELLYFNVIRQSINKVNLDWSTASELNNRGFDVERMRDFPNATSGLQNETEFTKIAWVNGNGTTNNISYYNLVDDNGYEGVSYYRLKQIDFDGTYSYSDIKAVSGWKSQGNSIDIFPNPINDYINIRLTSESKEISLQLFDAKGSLIISKTKAVPADKLITLYELGNLADGVYLLSIRTDNGELVTKKIIKKEG